MSLRTPQCHDDLVNFRIKRLLMLGGAPAVRICEGEFGVPRQCWRLLAALVEHGQSSPTQLAVCTGVEQARASRALADLVEKGLAVRTADPADARRAVVRVTPKGRRLYAALLPRLAAVNTHLLSVLDDDELATFERCLAKLCAHAARVLDALPASAPKADRRRGGSRRVWHVRESADRAAPAFSI
jgi:DNA-binding MarR family transcriptional regulator